MLKKLKTVVVDQRSERTPARQYWRRLKLRLVAIVVLGLAMCLMWALWRIISAWALVLAVGAIVWMVAVENCWLKIERVRLTSPKLQGPLKILQISDFHSNQWVLRQIERTIRTEQSDMIALTGDIFDGAKADNSAARRLIEQLPSDLPSVLVWGNHEVDYPEIFRIAQRATLQTKTQQLGGQVLNMRPDVAVAGVDWGERAELMIDQQRFNLLLVHHPKTAFKVEESGDFDLILCGHQHGGQVALPLVGGLINAEVKLLPDIFRQPTKGLHKVGRSLVYICSGAGFSGLPVRLNNRVQVSVIEIVPVASDK